MSESSRYFLLLLVQLYIKPMLKNYSTTRLAFLFLFAFQSVAPTVNAQYCVSGGPSSTIDSNVESVDITGTSGAISYNGCPGVAGVQLVNGQTTSLSRGNSFTLDVQFGTCGGNFAGAGQVWIDYNQNFLFEAVESIGTWVGTPPTALSSFNFTVPVGATLGTTRMRVTQQEGGTLPLNPCAAFNWGSVMDFTITIVEGVDCSGYLGDDISDAIDVSTLPYTDASTNAVCYTDQHTVYPSPDVFYKVTLNPAEPYLTASLCGSNFDTYLTIIAPDGTTVLDGNDDGPGCAPQSEIQLYVGGYPYVYVIVEGWALQTGNYILNINDNSVGLEENMLSHLNIFPNPANEGFYLNNLQSGHLAIKDSRGNEVLSDNVNDNAFVWIDNLANGIYFVTYSENGFTTTLKLLKQP